MYFFSAASSLLALFVLPVGFTTSFVSVRWPSSRSELNYVSISHLQQHGLRETNVHNCLFDHYLFVVLTETMLWKQNAPCGLYMESQNWTSSEALLVKSNSVLNKNLSCVCKSFTHSPNTQRE